MVAVTALAEKKTIIREYSIQILQQKQSPDSLAHWSKASASTNNVLGSSGHRNLSLSQNTAKKPKFEVFKPKARRNETQKFHFRGSKSVSALIKTLLQRLRLGHSHPFVD